MLIDASADPPFLLNCGNFVGIQCRDGKGLCVADPDLTVMRTVSTSIYFNNLFSVSCSGPDSFLYKTTASQQQLYNYTTNTTSPMAGAPFNYETPFLDGFIYFNGSSMIWTNFQRSQLVFPGTIAIHQRCDT